MAGLKDTTIATGYKSLLRVDDNSGVGSSSLRVTDGEGNVTSLKVSEDVLQVIPKDTDGSCFEVYSKDSEILLRVNSTNDYVTVLDHYVNTQYAYFGNNSGETSSNAAGYHYPLVFQGGMGTTGVAVGDQPNHFGNGSDPATTFTTADATDQKAFVLIRYMMYVPDNISVDAVYSLEGADAATGDTTRFHLMSYTFTSGSTSCLTSGTLVAHSSDTTNAGSEQVYYNNWTIDSEDITAGKVLICTFESDSVNSDYTYQAIIKYHLT